MYALLKPRGELSLFPEEYRTAKSFAQTDLINWFSLTYAVKPVEIELKKLVEIKLRSKATVSDYYVFRILTDFGQGYEKNWVAGWVGPYPKEFDFFNVPNGEQTSVGNDGWESKSPRQHVIDYLQTVYKDEIE